MEGLQALIHNILRHWWADPQKGSLEDLTRKTESLLDLQGSDLALEQNFLHKSPMERKQTYGTKNDRSHVLNIEKCSQLEDVSSQCGSTSSSHSYSNTSISMAELVVAVGSGEVDVDDIFG